MRRSITFALCVCLLTLASATTLAALAREVHRPRFSEQVRAGEIATANVDLVRRFYADVAAVLATGDATMLDPLLSPDLIEHPDRPGVASGRDGFLQALLAVRATFPGLRLVVDDVRPAGEDQVVARVHTSGADAGVFLGRAVPISIGQLGTLEMWRIADDTLVERWGDPVPVALRPMGQAPLSVDALGPGHRRMTVTQVSLDPGAWLPVDNGQAIRVFAIQSGMLTVDDVERSRDAVALVPGPAALPAGNAGAAFSAIAGDLVVTEPDATYTLANKGPVSVNLLVVVISNTLEGDWPLNSASAAASWTVAAMPEALGGALPSPAGVAARVLAAGVELELPERSMLSLGWVVLAQGATFLFPAGGNTSVSVVVEGQADLMTTVDAGAEHLSPGEATVIPAGVGQVWPAGESGLTSVLMLTLG
jgi:hypothetical protein